MSDENKPSPQGAELLKLVFQLAILESRLHPLLPDISKKLVADMLNTGTPAKNIAKCIGRSPSYVHAIAGGEKTCSAQTIMKLCQFAAAYKKEQEASKTDDSGSN